MSLREGLLKLVDDLRSLTGPDFADIRINQLTIRTRVWSGGRIDLGDPTDTDLVLPAQYPIRYVNAQEMRESGGEYEVGDVLVDHITPLSPEGSGYTPQQLDPRITSDDTEVKYLITGGHAGEYRRLDLRSYRAFTYQLVLRRTVNQ